MGTLFSLALTLIAGILLILVLILLCEVLAAAFLSSSNVQSYARDAARPRIAVLVPAHNESSSLRPTIEDVKAGMRTGDRVIVIADNCSDDTAAVAVAAGAEVIARDNLEKIGKGYALEWGLRHLTSDHPEIVVVIDADCRVAPGSLDQLAVTCAMTGRPAQALDLMKAPDQSAINYQVAEFAWRVKNWVRPLGLLTVGLPCQLMGTGMAFPWKVIRSAKLASGQVVEDLNLGLELAAAGHLPLFCPAAQVSSTFPTSSKAADRQRQRWEQGHLDLILAQTPRLLVAAIRQRSLGLFAMVLDLAVPPLILLGFLCFGALMLAGLAALLGLSSVAFYVSGASFAALLMAISLSWITFGRDILPARSFWSLGPYALQKLRLYYRLSSGGRISQWNRTDRK